MSQSNKQAMKEARVKEAKQKKRNQTILASFIIVCLIAVVTVLVITSQPTTIKVTRSTNGDLHIATNNLKSGLNYIDYGGPQELLLMQDGSGIIRTAYNTCQECYADGKVNYTLNGSLLICSICQTEVSASILGTASWGGCQPVAIPVEYRNDTSSEVIIPADVLSYAEDVFWQWDLSNFNASLSQYNRED